MEPYVECVVVTVAADGILRVFKVLINDVVLVESDRHCRKFNIRRVIRASRDHIPPSLRHRIFTLFDLPKPSTSSILAHSWNQRDASVNIMIIELTMIRSIPVDSSDCVRGRIGWTTGLHAWEIIWEVEKRGTHAVIGVATEDCPLQGPGYQAVVGGNVNSWGWDIVRNVLIHNSPEGTGPVYPSQNYRAPEKIRVILDCDNGTLSFIGHKEFLGIAFENLQGRKLYPIVCCVFGHANVTMRYINSMRPEPTSLMDMCRRVIRFHIIGPNRERKINSLHIPRCIRKYLMYRD